MAKEKSNPNKGVEDSLEFLRGTAAGGEISETPKPGVDKLIENNPAKEADIEIELMSREKFEEYLKSLELKLFEYINKTNPAEVSYGQVDLIKQRILSGEFSEVSELLAKDAANESKEASALLRSIVNPQFRASFNKHRDDIYGSMERTLKNREE